MPTGRQVFDQTVYGSSGGGSGGGGPTGTIMGGPAQIASKLHLNTRNKGRNKGRNRGRIKNRAKRR